MADNNNETSRQEKTSSYTVFNAVDDLVSKPVLGSDGAASWQSFRSDVKVKGVDRHAPTAPLKRIDRELGHTSWKDERSHEADVRKAAGSAQVNAGYTEFKPQRDDSVLSKKQRMRIEKRLIGSDQEYFIATDQKFTGWKWDYVFTTKESQGTGYYFDGMDSLKELKGELKRPAQTSEQKVETNSKKKTTGPDDERKPSKKKKKKKVPLVVETPNNPLQQVAAVLAANQTSSCLLPPGWESARDGAADKVYYYNRTTGERTWEKPTTEWIATTDASTGKEYYYNAKTRETVWERPNGMV